MTNNKAQPFDDTFESMLAGNVKAAEQVAIAIMHCLNKKLKRHGSFVLSVVDRQEVCTLTYIRILQDARKRLSQFAESQRLSSASTLRFAKTVETPLSTILETDALLFVYCRAGWVLSDWVAKQPPMHGVFDEDRDSPTCCNLESLELRIDIQKLLDELEPDDRWLVEARGYEKSPVEIAKILHCKEETARQRLHRLRNKLKSRHPDLWSALKDRRPDDE